MMMVEGKGWKGGGKGSREEGRGKGLGKFYNRGQLKIL